MTISYLSGTTVFEEGKSYELEFYIPDYAGKKLWVIPDSPGSRFAYRDDFKLGPRSDYVKDGGTKSKIDEKTGIASIKLKVHRDKFKEHNGELLRFTYYAGNTSRKPDLLKTDKALVPKFKITNNPDSYEWEFAFSKKDNFLLTSKKAEKLEPISELLEGERIRDGDGVYLCIVPKFSYPLHKYNIYYKITAETGSKTRLIHRGRFTWAKTFGKRSLYQLAIRDKDQEDTIYTAYFYNDKDYKHQIADAVTLAVRDFRTYSYDLMQKYSDRENYYMTLGLTYKPPSRYVVHVGAGVGDGSATRYLEGKFTTYPFYNFERILVDYEFRGTKQDDFFKARHGLNGGSYLLEGGGGDDKLIGRSGNDLLIGGKGQDVLRAGDGDDTISGGPGSDKMFGSYGKNTFEDTRDWDADKLYIRPDPVVKKRQRLHPKADKIVRLDALDKIFIEGVKQSDIDVGEVSDFIRISKKKEAIRGLGIYVSGYVQAIYVGDDLSLSAFESMTRGTLR